MLQYCVAAALATPVLHFTSGNALLDARIARETRHAAELFAMPTAKDRFPASVYFYDERMLGDSIALCNRIKYVNNCFGIPAVSQHCSPDVGSRRFGYPQCPAGELFNAVAFFFRQFFPAGRLAFHFFVEFFPVQWHKLTSGPAHQVIFSTFLELAIPTLFPL